MINPKDPLAQNVPDRAKQLFMDLGKFAAGFSHEEVAGAAGNLLINALRQENATWPRAEVVFDELLGRLKQALKDNYNGAGNRRSVFPHDQVISADFIDLPNKFFKS